MNSLVAHLNKLFTKMLGDLLDTLLSVKTMELSLLLNQKFYPMDLTALKSAKKSLKEWTKLSSLPFQKTIFSLKACSLNPTWLPLDLQMLTDKRFHVKKSLSEPPLPYLDQYTHPVLELCFCLEDKVKKRLVKIWMLWTN